MQTCFLDTETAGLTCPAIIIQTQFDDGPIEVHNVWKRPAGETRDLIRRIVDSRVVAHNLTFDWQVIHRTWAGLSGFTDDEIPTPDRFAVSEFERRADVCLRPQAAICTLLLCQKQLGGTFLATKEVRVRQIPMRVAHVVATALNNQTDLPPILFARGRQGAPWKVAESDHGPDWADVVMKFAPSNALKDIASLVFGEEVQHFGEITAPTFGWEIPYCPYVELLERNGLIPVGVETWKDVLWQHVEFWDQPGSKQWKYSVDDIRLLRRLYDHLGSPEFDEDGELAVQVASVRLSGFELDHNQLVQEFHRSDEVVQSAEVNVNSPKQVKEYIGHVLDPMEAHVIADGCNKAKLKKLVKVFDVDEEEECCDTGCPRCGGLGYLTPGNVPVVKRADHILQIRKHTKRRELYSKLMQAGYAFPGFRVVGTKSGRMSGADGINYHGIDGSPEIRKIFTLAHPGEIVSGGDFDSQELAIAAAVMQDRRLAEEMSKGKSLHGMFAAEMSGLPYEQIMVNKEDKSTIEADYYKVAKAAVYAILYGAGAFTVAKNTGKTEEEAQAAIDKFFTMFLDAKRSQDEVKDLLTCVRHGENGSIDVFQPKQDHIESIFGYRRSFKIEISVIQIIASAMKAVREELRSHTGTVVRREKKGEQTVCGAALSAMYGAAFSIQGRIIRAALNHKIQSAGRTCTIGVQYAIWERCQPRGIHAFRLRLMSIHDELAACSSREVAKEIEAAVVDKVHDLQRTVPLLGLEWVTDVGSWYGIKKPPHEGLQIGFSA